MEFLCRDSATDRERASTPLLLVGRGKWAGVYAKTLKNLRIKFWQATHDWHCFNPSGVIIATPAETHYRIARTALGRRIPVLVEKPVCLSSTEAHKLVGLGGIAFAGHTRLYSPAWMAFKAKVGKASHVEAWAGGTERDPWWDWGPHLVAMSFDLGCKPVIHVTQEKQPLRLVADGHEFTDVADNPLEVLLSEFCAAIALGKPDNRLMPEVIDYLENECPSRTLPA